MSSQQDTQNRPDINFVLNGMPSTVQNSNNNNNSNNINANINTSSSSGLMNNNSNSVNHEQPQTKRQKIEKIKSPTTVANSSTVANVPSSATIPCPPDIIQYNSDKIPLCSSLSSSINSISTHSSSSNNSPSSTPCSSRASSLTQLLNVQNLAASILPPPASKEVTSHSIHNDHNMVASASSGCSSSSVCSSNDHSADEVDRVTLPDLLSLSSSMAVNNNAAATSSNGKLLINNLSSSCHTVSNANVVSTAAALSARTQRLDEISASQDMREFEESLNRQCLCGVSERMLRKPFQSHYSMDANGQKRVANLSEWPTNKLLQFLSNLQLLFDIYLKQNSKGFICARIMDVCDALIRNDHNLIDEIIVLAGYNNMYVQFLAGRVLASFLVIAKQEMDDDWLKKLVDNLFNFDRLDHVAVQKMHFSLEIIKRIVEWKDIDLHPLEEEIAETHSIAEPTASTSMSESRHGYLHFQTQQTPLETNYFAMHYRSTENIDDAAVPNNEGSSAGLYTHSSSSSMHQLPGSNSHHHLPHQHHFNGLESHIINHHHTAAAAAALGQSCHLVTLTDSESFDTTHLKCITIKILENKWPALVKNMSALIANHLDVENAENCILNFLQLWENIISVKANLSIVETLPFYAQLDKFELLLNQHLPCTVYKQMLCLFNEALCYGSTLALQDMLPDETCMLAHQIVRHVKDFRILESLPRRQPENIVGFIGFKRKPVSYAAQSLQHHTYGHHGGDDDDVNSSALNAAEVIEMDKTILQKIVLLVLKSIAVTVKEIRSDSSDSSIDSTDYDAFQDMVLIERSIRDVLRKLESFIKHTLEFHPECHFSKILIHLFDDQDDHLIEAMVCTLDVTAGISFRNNAFPELVSMLNPVYTFLEFLKMISNSSDLLLDLLVSNETCFLLYLLRFLKYIRMNWSMFVQSCHDFGMGASTLDEAMSVLIRLRLQISRLVSRQLYPYDISPVLRLLESCESLYEGNELS
ncbi:protein lines homolog [Musca autumnalis]|uniref:protein lines homolog n=1 Tax=Musca autumnalis TaxID=221902 RepID=UPI003CF1D1B2